jgi:mono/diheme cytochrome c family protein
MGKFTMPFLRLIPLVMILGGCRIGWAQSPTYGLGRTPSAEEIQALDISISPTGKELPAGNGTAKEGAQLFVQRGCSVCHGATGSGGLAPPLIRPKGIPPNPAPGDMAGMEMGHSIIALHSPYATTIWDYIHRGMPLGKEGTLKPNEVYSLVAFLLYKNGVIQEDEVMDAQSLPKVKMPNREGFAPQPEWKHGTPRLQGFP